MSAWKLLTRLPSTEQVILEAVLERVGSKEGAGVRLLQLELGFSHPPYSVPWENSITSLKPCGKWKK